ncbi:MAG: hypothetical protein P8Y85_05095 [Nitrospirota bacterium]
MIFFTFPILLAITAGYLCLLFFAAYYAEHRERAGRSIAANPYVYSLSLAVYCTSWTFYGSVGKAATSGISFLTIYLGPTLMVALWWVVMKKVITIAKENRITTIADFIGSRYGNSIGLSALVTVVALVGITPYLGLQIKAIMSTFMILAGEARGTLAAGWVITLMLGVFAIIFGARRLDLSEKHEGLVFAIAFESIVKLAAFLAVGLYVTFWLFGGFGDIFGKLRETVYGELLYMGPVPRDGGGEQRRQAPQDRHVALPPLPVPHKPLRPSRGLRGPPPGRKPVAGRQLRAHHTAEPGKEAARPLRLHRGLLRRHGDGHRLLPGHKQHGDEQPRDAGHLPL